MDKDKLGLELKDIMEDEVRNIELSQDLKAKIMMNRKISLRSKINDFLNREIEIPLIPLVATFSLFILLVGIPKDLIKREGAMRTINIGSSQMIVRDNRKVGGKNED